MGSHPVNLIVRFLLEISALIAGGLWGWNRGDNVWMHYLLGFGIPVLMASIWGIFAVPEDPSRSGKSPVITPGIIRLMIEFSFFGFACWALYDLNYVNLSYVFGITTAVHYIASYDRVMWLISR
jgi:hypothetical protein